MAELITAAQMRAIEAEAIASGRVTGLELMERAGRGVVEAIFEEWPELAATSHRAVVLCGPGNNGGDGFVVARLLKEWGWEVEVFLYGDPEKLPPDARVNYERWLKLADIRAAETLDNDQALYDMFERPLDLFVDALFGIGLSRPLQLERPGNPDEGDHPDDIFLTALCQWMEVPEFDAGSDQTIRSVAIDVPSGLCGGSGRALEGEAFRASLTVTFHAMKHGHMIGEGPSRCGKIKIVDIGLETGYGPWVMPERIRGKVATPGRVVEATTQLPPKFAVLKLSTSHKYNHGHALVLSGSMGRSGAARLAARAALRVGAGLVTVAAPGSAMMECATQLTAIMLRKCDGAEGLSALLEDKRLNALCLGPGLGVGQGTRDLVGAALADSDRAVVLDADALTSFSDDPRALFSLLHGNVVLTPHGGEFARLFPDIFEELNAPATQGPAFSKVDASRAAAARAGCTVLFKGPDTLIADPSGSCAISAAVYDRAAPWLATAGSGDVLAGLITGLLARGLPPTLAAETAAWLHVEAARAFGPGLIAEDLPEMLPQVFRDLGL
ncbi:NAD(P)H-hydrate dehydratase [Gymnodinialimonas sp.]